MSSTGGGPDGSGSYGADGAGQASSVTPVGSGSQTGMASRTGRTGHTSFDADTEPGIPLLAHSHVADTAGNGGRKASRWRRALALILNRYPALPPAPQGWLARISLALVALMAAAYALFFSLYLFARHDAYLTNAEDMGNMDQALWNTVHGAILHQTICNIVSDTNCLGDVSRFAIHFEPIMLVISLLYVFIPSPKTLIALQAIVVAVGAFPTYWIASRKLRSSLAGVAFALVYLLFPALQAAVIYPFHAVTLAATFLMFAFYFLLTRNNTGLFIASILVMSTKEEAPLTILMIALSVMLLQRRWKVGGLLAALSVAWTLLALAVIHFASPVGQSSTASRYANALHHPLAVIHSQVLGPGGIFYLRTILSPAAYLPLLSPLTLLIAVPEMLINLLSSDPAMRAGIYHYNALIVPVLVFAAIQTVGTLAGLTAWLVDRAPTMGSALSGMLAQGSRIHGETWERARRLPYARTMMLALTLLTLFFGVYEQRERGDTPLAKGFSWPQVTAHTQLANSLLSLIPPDASVSAQSDLAPHISHRRYIYLYPYMGDQADYVFLDVTGSLYPLGDQPQVYFQSVVNLLHSGAYHVVAARDGYLLLKRGAGARLDAHDPYGLPTAFYSFAQTPTGATPPHALDVAFGSSLRLVGYDVAPAPTLYLNNGYITVTTYWQVAAPLTATYHPEFVFTRQDGSEYVDRDFPTSQWLPITNWRPGTTYVVRSLPLFLTARELGTLRLGVRIAQGTPTDGTLAPLTASVASDSAPVTLLDNNTVAAFYNEQVAK
ncbi:MAG: DUF2079 domain-containing protein [Ktedonobacterales bacterium]